jgi:hypothetical protein
MEDAMELSVSLDTICRIIIRARELEAQVPSNDPDETDEEAADADDGFAVLVDEDNQAVEAEILAIVEDLADDQVAEVLALAWIGRGTYDSSEWDDALEAANDPDAESPGDQLLEMPMLAACLDAGLAAFDLSCEGIGQID